MAQFLVYFWRRAAQLRTSESGSIYGGHQQLHKIKDNEEWEECNQIIMKVPIYTVCEMGQSKKPLVLIAIVR